MSSDCTTLRHNALVYESTDEYLARAVPFLKAGIEAGEGAVVAHTKPGLAMMREALGPEAARVTFVDVSAAYTRPARTLAAYHKVYVEQLRKTPTLRAVADVQFGPDPNEWDLWTGYEAVFNRSFGHLPAWVLCSYDANGTPDPIIEGVWQTHPEVVAGDSWNSSDHYEDPDHLLRRITPAPAPLTGLRPIPFGRGAEELREQLAPRTRRRQDKRSAITRPAARRHRDCEQRDATRRRHPRSPCWTRPRTIRLRDRRPRRRLRRPRSRLSRATRGNRCRPLDRPAADLAD